MKVLIVKLSSMGDILHALPAVTDAQERGYQFDWVVNPAFAEVPNWHPAINRVITIDHRSWKKNLFRAIFKGEIKQFIRELRQTQYDLIIDAQGSYKGAIVGALARGKIASFDKNSVREYGAHWFYHRRFAINKNQHAIERIRQLFAKALKYPLPSTSANYGIDKKQFPKPDFNYQKPLLIFNTNTTWPSKYWPKPTWQQLIKHATAAGFHILLPWGNEKERQYSQDLIEKNTNAELLPKSTLTQIAGTLSQATAVVSVDTGLGHLAAALSIPAISLYGPTDPKLIGAIGKHQVHLRANFPCNTCQPNYKHSQHKRWTNPCCYQNIDAETIWQQLQPLVNT